MHESTCSYCGVGCGILVKKDYKGQLSVEGNPDHPANKGMLCSKGRNLHYVVQDTTDRLLYPHMRYSRESQLKRVSWDAAMKRAAAVFGSIIKKHGPDSVGFYVSGQCLTEEYYLVNKLVKGFIGTNNIDTNSRLCMSSAVAGYVKTFGEDSVPISYEDIELADTFLIAGANPAWCHPILFRRLEAHKAQHPKVKIIVVDPRKTASCSIADLHLQILPGTDVYLFAALARRLWETKRIDAQFIRNHTEGFEAYKAWFLQIPLRKAAKICGIEVDLIKKAANLIGNAKGFISMWAMGLNQSVFGVDKNLSLLNLSLMTGHVGKPGSGPFSLTGQPNAMGGREVGGMSTLLAAHRDQKNPHHRKEVANFWGVQDLPAKPGLTATQMFDALENGSMKAVWIICTNPMVSLPQSNRMERALKNARFVVVQDISNRSDTAAFADLVLPAAGWLEKEGTMTNSDRRINYLPKVIDAPGEALADAEILCRFAQEMGYAGFDFNNASEIYDEHCSLTRGTNIDISGLNYNRLQQEGSFQWPVPYEDHQGTERLFTDKKFYTPSQKAQFNIPSQDQTPSEPPSTSFPLILTTGRIRDQWHTMTKTGKVQKLNSHYPRAFLEIHPVDAVIRDIKDGDVVIVKNPRGEVRVKAKVSRTIRSGVVFLPMHWGKILNQSFSRANNLTANRFDPVSKEPDFKYATVEVDKYVKPKQKICIIGAGAAAYRFVESYRTLNQTDEIHVFSKEEFPFYNRVLLPEYISEQLSWEDLEKIKRHELRKLNIKLYPETAIEKIDTQQKEILDHTGKTHSYDVLIGATGSRPYIPREVPMKMPGVFTMRERGDADRLKEYLNASGLPKQEQRVLIAGGGLLGLELAASLRTTGVQVTVIQRGSRLMVRQLDPTGSRVLAEEVAERGIQIYFDNEVDTIFSSEGSKNLTVTLKSGKIISCYTLVFAIGTRPNIELFKAAGVNCSRGVEVNEYLQSSDPNLYCIGEIAEFKQKLYGITSAAEQQAESLAHYLWGDLGSIYQGSTAMNILKFEDLSLCSIGEIHYPKHDPNYEEIIFTDLNKRYYKKCIVKNDKLVGAILIGDKAEFAEYKTLIDEQVELSEKRNELLRSGKAPKAVKGKMICSCNHVGTGNIKDLIQEGTTDFEGICKISGAGLGCGSCKPEVKSFLTEHLV